MVMPRMVVFDLDACCWRPEMYEMHAGPPFSDTEDSSIKINCEGREVELLGIVPEAWRKLYEDKEFRETKIGIASRCDQPEWARQLLNMYEIKEGVTMWEAVENGHLAEIYKGNKQSHFKALQAKTGIPFEDMIFFDDDYFNISSVSKLGVTCVLTPDGVTQTAWDQAISAYALNKQNST